jgi:hypothetical protein
MLFRLTRLNAQDRLLLFRALGILLKATVIVRLLPFSMLRKTLQSAPAIARSNALQPAEHITWAIEVISRRLSSSCLVRAIAAQCLLAQYGHSATLHIGVMKDPDGKFGAHAWLERNGVVLVGGSSAPIEFRELDFLASDARRGSGSGSFHKETRS